MDEPHLSKTSLRFGVVTQVLPLSTTIFLMLSELYVNIIRLKTQTQSGLKKHKYVATVKQTTTMHSRLWKHTSASKVITYMHHRICDSSAVHKSC